MARYRPNAPAARAGVSPSCVVTPQGKGAPTWPSLLAFLQARFPRVAADVWHQRLAAGDVVDAAGHTVTPQSPFEAGCRIYYFRAVEQEPRIPAEAHVLWQNDHLVVVDKPHFLPVTPTGKYLNETLLVRLRNSLGLDALSPIHRIDRDTAGLVLFSKQASSRAAYHQLFRSRQVEKTYECIAAWNPNLPWPLRRHTRIAPAAHFMQECEVLGEPNALTHIEVLEVGKTLARYALKPVTGHRHQLRVHMNALGLPIANDGIYPRLTPEGSSNFERPLQLLAKTLVFTDPLTGERLEFQSLQKLRGLDYSS